MKALVPYSNRMLKNKYYSTHSLIYFYISSTPTNLVYLFMSLSGCPKRAILYSINKSTTCSRIK